MSIDFSASLIVSFNNSQYKFIDLLASSLPGTGKLIPVGSELVSKTAIIGIFSFLASATAKDSILVSIIKIKSGGFSFLKFHLMIFEVFLFLYQI